MKPKNIPEPDRRQLGVSVDALPTTAKVSGTLIDEKFSKAEVVKDKKPQLSFKDVSEKQIDLEKEDAFSDLEPPESEAIDIYSTVDQLSVKSDLPNVPQAETAEYDSAPVDFSLPISGEVDFDDEVMAVFEQLVEMMTIDQPEAATTIPESDGVLVKNQIILPGIEIGDSAEVNAFEAFIMTQPKPEVVLDFETIKNTANEQPLEVGLVQLALLLEEVTPDTEALIIMVKELSDSFVVPAHESGGQPDAIRITPEITKNLLALLRLIGYENPGKVLLEFVSRYDLEFLVQAIRYLAQLTNQANRAESLRVKLFKPSLLHITRPTYIGRVALVLVKKNLEALQPV